MVSASYKSANITGKHLTRFCAEIWHVAGRVDVHFGRSLWKGGVCDDVFGGTKRRYQIVVSGPNHQAQMRVSAHRYAQILSVVRIGSCAGAAAVIPMSIDGAKRDCFVGLVNRDAQLVVLIGVEAGDKARNVLAHGRIVSHGIFAVRRERQRVACVVSSDLFAAVFQKFLFEGYRTDSQIILANEIREFFRKWRAREVSNLRPSA